MRSSKGIECSMYKISVIEIRYANRLRVSHINLPYLSDDFIWRYSRYQPQQSSSYCTATRMRWQHNGAIYCCSGDNQLVPALHDCRLWYILTCGACDIAFSSVQQLKTCPMCERCVINFVDSWSWEYYLYFPAHLKKYIWHWYLGSDVKHFLIQWLRSSGLHRTPVLLNAAPKARNDGQPSRATCYALCGLLSVNSLYQMS